MIRFFPLYSTEKSQDEGVFDTPVTTLYSGPEFAPYRQNSAHKRRRNFAYQVWDDVCVTTSLNYSLSGPEASASTKQFYSWGARHKCNAYTITKPTSLLDTLFVNAFKCRDKQRTVRTVPSSFPSRVIANSITVEFALISWLMYGSQWGNLPATCSL